MISTADLQDWLKADDADAPVLRALEEAAVKAIEQLTGRYYGVSETVTEVIRFRGFPIPLSDTPNAGVTLLEQSTDGATWTTVPTDTYYVWNSFIFSLGSWSTLSLVLFRATYDRGYTVDPNDSDVWNAPADVQQAVKLLVGDWFENREASVTGTIQTDLEHGLKMLLASHTRVAV